MCLGFDMQVVNNNQSAATKLSQHLPKPVPPPIVTAQTNTPVKNPAPMMENQKFASPNSPSLKPAVAGATAPQPITNTSVQRPIGSTIGQKPVSPVANNLGASSQSSIYPGRSLPTTNDQKLVPTEQIGIRKEGKIAKKGKKQKDKSEKNVKKSSGKKEIPTILGILLLVVSLVIGVIFFGNGTGLFAPRATPETTPKNITNSNITNKSFTVSFYTDEETIAFIKYGTSPNDIKKQVSDDRDQLSGVIKPYRLHHITVKGLEPNTTYYYLLGTGSNTTFDNGGNPFQIKTASDPGGVSPNNQTIYGTVSQANGQPGEGAIVFVTVEGASTLSTLVKSSGSWAVSLANAFNLSLNGYPEVNEDSVLSIKVQGIEPNSITSRVTNVTSAQPVPDIIMGQEAASTDDLSATREELLGESNQDTGKNSEDTEEIELEESTTENSLIAQESTESTAINQNVESQDSSVIGELNEQDRTLDLTSVGEEEDIVINSTQPIIKTNLPPNVTVKIEVNSDTAIETVKATDANGELVLDIASLEQSLSPGEHTVTYTYVDPNTGEEVRESYDFRVSASDDVQQAEEETSTIAAADTTTLPYGSGNPYVPSITPSVSPTPTPIATESARETVVSTESGTYNAGSVFETMSLLMVGLFFLATGVWSFLLAKQFKTS